MADVFSQMYAHLIFSPRHRRALIHPDWEEHLYKYITGAVQKRGHKMLAIGGMPDHIHLLIGQKPAESISDLVWQIKIQSDEFIRHEKLSPYKFEWQNGYGVFTHSRSQIDSVCKYVLNQKMHHQNKTFQAEFLKMCEDFGIDLGQKKVFDWVGEA
jgi:REP element-mobilizing transposase RayT